MEWHTLSSQKVPAISFYFTYMPLDTAWWTAQWNNSLQHFYGQSYVEVNWHYWERAQTYQKDANKNFYLLNSNWIWANYFTAWAKRPFSMIGKKHTHPFSRKSFPFTAWQDFPGLNSIISLLSVFTSYSYLWVSCVHTARYKRGEMLSSGTQTGGSIWSAPSSLLSFSFKNSPYKQQL